MLQYLVDELGAVDRKLGPPRERFVTDTEQLLRRLVSIANRAIVRCADTRNKRYGGRGIQVWPLWVERPLLFAVHLLSLPGCNDTTLSLDRMDNDGNYEPGNLRFATASEQRRNQARRRG